MYTVHKHAHAHGPKPISSHVFWDRVNIQFKSIPSKTSTMKNDSMKGTFWCTFQGSIQSFLNAFLKKMTFLFAKGGLVLRSSEKLRLFVHLEKITIRSSHSPRQTSPFVSLAKARPSSLGLVKGPKLSKVMDPKHHNFISKNYQQSKLNYQKLLKLNLINTQGNEIWPYKIKTQSFWGVTARHLSTWGVGSNELRCFYRSSCNWQRHSYRIRNGHVFQPRCNWQRRSLQSQPQHQQWWPFLEIPSPKRSLGEWDVSPDQERQTFF